MVDYILKYGTGNLIIIYHCTYSGLLDTIVDVIQNFMELIKGIGFGWWIDGWLKWSVICARRVENI